MTDQANKLPFIHGEVNATQNSVGAIGSAINLRDILNYQ
jgi:hypothetical protein